jgi:hypothetical protein
MSRAPSRVTCDRLGDLLMVFVSEITIMGFDSELRLSAYDRRSTSEESDALLLFRLSISNRMEKVGVKSLVFNHKFFVKFEDEV